MTPEAEGLEAGYWRSYQRFYQWRNVFRAATGKGSVLGTLRHLAYSGGRKKLEPVWGLVIYLSVNCFENANEGVRYWSLGISKHGHLRPCLASTN